MHKETETIFSSTGKLGVSRRPDERLYINGTFSEKPDTIRNNFHRVKAIVERHPQKVTRGVFRGIVDTNTMTHITKNGLHPYLEAALPLEEFGLPNEWLIYMAHNQPDRKPINPLATLVQATTYESKDRVAPHSRMKKVIQEGYTFHNQIGATDIDHIDALWGNTFGWQRHEIENLQKRLAQEKTIEPSQKNIWFSAIQHQGKIVSIAMAEGIKIPSKNGLLHCIESTEWATDTDHSGNGLMTANLVALQAQITNDMSTSSDRFIIFAECNIQSHADKAGKKAGFRIPNRQFAPQILVQNVFVEDGSAIEGKRDFAFMYVPHQILTDNYNSENSYAMTQLIV